MGVDHFFWFADQTFVHSLLEMSWKSFLQRYPVSRSKVESLVAFVLEPEPDAQTVADVLGRRNLRWVMARGAPAYFFLTEITDYVPAERRRTFQVESPFWETAALVAISCDAYLRHAIDEKTLWAAHNIAGREDPRKWLGLKKSEAEELESALGYGATEKPIFDWQSNECLDDGYSVLRTADCRRFIDFLIQAGDENWVAPRIRTDIRNDLRWSGRAAPRFRDVDLTKKLHRQVKKERHRFARPCALRYFGS